MSTKAKAEESSGEVWIQPDQGDLAGGDQARKEEGNKTPDFMECERCAHDRKRGQV